MRMTLSLANARELVLEYGWNSTSYQILNPGIEHWFAAELPAVVGYTRRSHVLLVAGAPVCAPETLQRVCGEFEAFARSQNCRVCYVCAEDRMHALMSASTTHAIVSLGAQPVWDPREWRALVQRHASVRHQLNRSRNKAVVVQSVDPARGSADPELRTVLKEWLRSRPLPPMHFLVEPDILSAVVRDRVLFVARRRDRVVAFLVASPIPARNGYLIELVARSPKAPNGTVELLIDFAMRRFANEGREYATLGLVALAHAADAGIRGNPFWLRWTMLFARLHANRFYNFRGTRAIPPEACPELLGAGVRDLERKMLLYPHHAGDGPRVLGNSCIAGNRNRRRESRSR